MNNRLAVTTALLIAIAAPALADTAAPTPPPTTLSGRGGLFPMQGGEAIYKGVCQGCHMPDAKGAAGAGVYPSLAANKNLESGGYPVYVIVRGQRAMPPFGAMMSDDQVAAVVNYLRTHFGNEYKDAVTAEDVKVVRP